MTKVTCDMAISVDGFAAGLNQSLDNPFGEGVGHRLVRWMVEEPDANAAAIKAITAARAYIMGRNMFSPGRGDWDEQWKGWWGDDPPYHAPVFVLTNHPREPVPMQGGTTFTFVTDGIESAMAQAREAAGDGDIAIAGGAEYGPSVPRGRADRRAAAARRAGAARRGRAAARRRRRPPPRAARGVRHRHRHAPDVSRRPSGIERPYRSGRGPGARGQLERAVADPEAAAVARRAARRGGPRRATRRRRRRGRCRPAAATTGPRSRRSSRSTTSEPERTSRRPAARHRSASSPSAHQRITTPSSARPRRVRIDLAGGVPERAQAASSRRRSPRRTRRRRHPGA